MSRVSPILFSAPMVRALIAGTKTQTRRVLKGAWQAALEGHDRVFTWFAPPHVPVNGIPNQWAESGVWADKVGPRGYKRYLGRLPHRPGDLLYVREAWRTFVSLDAVAPCGLLVRPDGEKRGAGVYFEAGGNLSITAKGERHPGEETINGLTELQAGLGRLRAGMHLPRWGSRITLEVTGVKVERLQDISEADAIAEGITPLLSPKDIARLARTSPEVLYRPPSWTNYLWHGLIGSEISAKQSDAWAHQMSGYRDPRGSYSSLWERINGAGSWDANPWIVAYTFAVRCQNVDDFLKERAA